MLRNLFKYFIIQGKKLQITHTTWHFIHLMSSLIIKWTHFNMIKTWNSMDIFLAHSNNRNVLINLLSSEGFSLFKSILFKYKEIFITLSNRINCKSLSTEHTNTPEYLSDCRIYWNSWHLCAAAYIERNNERFTWNKK